MSVIRAYNAALMRRPLLTQCASASLLFCAGDIIAQQVIEKRGRTHDYQRTARLTFYGGAIFGPFMTKWYQWLARLNFKNSRPSRTILTRVGLDQAVLTPVGVGFFFTSMVFLEGGGVREACQRIDAAYVPTLMRSWGVFIPIQVINFSLVPAHLRFMVVTVVSLFWNSYLSYTNAKQDVAMRSENAKDTNP